MNSEIDEADLERYEFEVTRELQTEQEWFIQNALEEGLLITDTDYLEFLEEQQQITLQQMEEEDE